MSPLGQGANKKPDALTWDEFREGFLPDNSKWESVSVTKGLVKKLGTEANPLFIINPKDFRMETNSVIPITHSKNASSSLKKINIGSMGIADDKLVSKHDITIKRSATDVTADFTFTDIPKNVPGALWGSKLEHSESEPENERLVQNACVGFYITGKPIETSAETHNVESEKLLNQNEDFGKTIPFGASVSLNKQWLKISGVRATVAQNIESKYTARNNLLTTLGFQDTYHPNQELVDEFILTTS